MTDKQEIAWTVGNRKESDLRNRHVGVSVVCDE